MPIAKAVADALGRSSWIRRMFEEGARLKRERGAENVFDFTLGNPDVEPPPQVLEALRRVAANPPQAMSHAYMPNAGYPAVRQAIANKLSRETGLQFVPEDILMTIGAAGACNVFLKSVLDPGDEVIVLVPFFPEYEFYITNHGGRMVPVETDETFLPDPERIAAAITPRTRAIMLNTPNNPTGRVYPERTLRDLEAMLTRVGYSGAVMSDEPYKTLVFDGKRQPEVASFISHTVICNSWSKSQGLPGERIGYLAFSPRLPEREQLRNACTFANRVLGFVNAPAIWQWVMLETADATVDRSGYEHKRNTLCDALAQIGYDIQRPEGAFYVFMKTPIPDDIQFLRVLAAEGVLAVPGTGFGRSGYVRLSLTVPLDAIQRSIPAFKRAFQKVKS
jgi:aspartate aminotransferase